MLLCPNHMAMSWAATVAQGERMTSREIKGNHHPPRRAKRVLLSPSALPLPIPPWVDAASSSGFSASFGQAWNFPQTTARSLQCISPSSYLLGCWQRVGDEWATGARQVVAHHPPITGLCLISPWQGAADGLVFAVFHWHARVMEEETGWRAGWSRRASRHSLGSPGSNTSSAGRAQAQANSSLSTQHWACRPPQPHSQPLPHIEATEPPASVLCCKPGWCSPGRQSTAPWWCQSYTLAHLQMRFSLIPGVQMTLSTLGLYCLGQNPPVHFGI